MNNVEIPLVGEDRYKEKKTNSINTPTDVFSNCPPYTSYATLYGHYKDTVCVKFSPDGKRLASGGSDSVVSIYTVCGRPLGQLLGVHSMGINDLAWSPCSNFIATASDDGICIIWSSTTFLPVQVLRSHMAPILCVQFNNDGSLLATGSSDETISLWEPASGACIRRIDAHTAAVSSLIFHPSSFLLLSGGFDGVVRIWDLLSCTCRRSVLLGEDFPISSIDVTPCGTFVAVATLDGYIRLYSIDSVRCVRAYRLPSSLYSHRVILHQPLYSNNKEHNSALRVVSTTDAGLVVFQDIETLDQDTPPKVVITVSNNGSKNQLGKLLFFDLHPAKARMATVHDGYIRLWSAEIDDPVVKRARDRLGNQLKMTSFFESKELPNYESKESDNNTVDLQSNLQSNLHVSESSYSSISDKSGKVDDNIGILVQNMYGSRESIANTLSLMNTVHSTNTNTNTNTNSNTNTDTNTIINTDTKPLDLTSHIHTLSKDFIQIASTSSERVQPIDRLPK